jgi:hypothetical protein
LFESFFGNFSPKRLKNESFIELFISVFLLVIGSNLALSSLFSKGAVWRQF